MKGAVPRLISEPAENGVVVDIARRGVIENKFAATHVKSAYLHLRQQETGITDTRSIRKSKIFLSNILIVSNKTLKI